MIHRWPSARPDAIVTEDEYYRVKRSILPSNIAKALTKRVPWERGLHQNYTGASIISFKVRVRERIPCFLKDVYGDQPLFANTDMAKRWHLLGFVVQRPSEGPEPIFVETQRGDLHKDSYYARKQVPVDAPRGQLHTLSSKPRRRYGHGIPLPTPEQGNDPIVRVESLRQHLQTAMAVELSTIPLYLFGMYSVQTPKEYVNDPRYYNPITGAIRSTFDSIRIYLSFDTNVSFFLFVRCCRRRNASFESCWKYSPSGRGGAESL